MLFLPSHTSWLKGGPSFRKLPFYVEKKHGGKVLSRKVTSLSNSNQGSSREYSLFESIRKFDYRNGLFQYFQSQAKVWLVKKETDLDSIFCLISDFSSDIYWQHSFLSLKAIIDTYYWTWPVLLNTLYGCSYVLAWFLHQLFNPLVASGSTVSSLELEAALLCYYYVP